MNELDNFYLSKDEPNKSCLLALRSLILKQNNNISETIKWGMPCFTFKRKIFCYLWIDKKKNEPYILMVEGKYLDHPALETGNRSRMKILRIDPNKDLPVTTINAVLNQAIEYYLK